jgi:hypothetical protein
MKRGRQLQPFGYLATSINYWRLFIPSRERGITLRSHVLPEAPHGLLFTSPITPLRPATGTRLATGRVLYMPGKPFAPISRS